MKAVIVKRTNGVTSYKAHKGNAILLFSISTSNKWMLLLRLQVQESNRHCMLAGNMPISCLVALQNPSLHPKRTVVDHANQNPSNDCASNLHWVMPAFNAFNVKEKKTQVRTSRRC